MLGADILANRDNCTEKISFAFPLGSTNLCKSHGLSFYPFLKKIMCICVSICLQK